MSIEVIKSQINNFLSNETPEVMAIKGKWGIGKTYSWNKFLEEAKNNKKIKFKKYSYVSLFGINSLDAFKYTIFEHTVSCDLIGTEANIETFKDNIVGTSSALGKKGVEFFKTRSTTHAIESFAFLSIRETIICLDDLERKGKNLEIKDVLGLVSLLKEQKKCKVILLLNDGEEGLEDYIKYREKVIDSELEFSLTAEESVEIALQGTELNDYAASILKESSIKLDIRNIRILKKIERLTKLAISYLDDFESEVTHQAVSSLTLFSWCYYCHESDGAPPLDFVITQDHFAYAFGVEKESSDKDEKWRSVISNYGYKFTDELDLLLSKSVRTGYFIEDEIKSAASKNNKEIIANKSAEAFYNAWDLYRDSFDNNQDKVVATLYENFKKFRKYIAPRSLDETVCLFREFGEDDKADEVIDLYIDARKEEVDLFHPDTYSDFGGIKDQSILKKFNAIYQSSVICETATQVLERISRKNGWNSSDVITLSNTGVDEYYQIFKSITGRRERSAFIKTCLQFGQFANASAQQKEIAARAIEALKRIAKESPINKSRVALYGIQLDDE